MRPLDTYHALFINPLSLGCYEIETAEYIVSQVSWARTPPRLCTLKHGLQGVEAA